MKYKKIILSLISILIMGNVACAAMMKEDIIGKDYWDKLNQKEKEIFLMGYRHAIGMHPLKETKAKIKGQEIKCLK